MVLALLRFPYGYKKYQQLIIRLMDGQIYTVGEGDNRESLY